MKHKCPYIYFFRQTGGSKILPYLPTVPPSVDETLQLGPDRPSLEGSHQDLEINASVAAR